MRGLPPVPFEVLEMKWRFAVGDSDASSTTYYSIAGGNVLARDQVIDVCDAIAFDFLDLFKFCTTDGAQIADYEATFHVGDFFTFVKPLTPNHGLWPGTPFVNTACAVYWQTGLAQRRGHAMTYFPTFPAAYTDDGRTINSNGYDNVRDACFRYLDRVYGIPVPGDLSVRPVLVSRVAHDAPRDRAVVYIITAGQPVRHVADMGRRLRLSRRVQSE